VRLRWDRRRREGMALLTVLLRGGGMADTLPQVGRLVVFAAAMFALAVFLFRRRTP